MIGRIRGTLVEKSAVSVVIDVGGVGYSIAVTPRSLAELPGIGEEAVLHTLFVETIPRINGSKTIRRPE